MDYTQSYYCPVKPNKLTKLEKEHRKALPFVYRFKFTLLILQITDRRADRLSQAQRVIQLLLVLALTGVVRR